MTNILAIIIGYLLGTVNPAFIAGKLHGFDIRTRGSMNAGASNAKITLGWPYFIISLVYDACKAILSMVIVKYLLNGEDIAVVLAGVAAVYGHCYPFYLGFKGGKGFASYIGMSLFINFPVAAIIIIIGLIGAFAFNYIVVATVFLTVAFPIYLYAKALVSFEVLLVIVAGSAIILWKHRVNAVKLYNGEEIGINGKPLGLKKK